MQNRFDLKAFRENELKISQERLATLIGVKQDAISRMEKNPSQIPVEMMIKIAENTGQTLDELIKYKKPDLRPLEPEPKYEDVRFDKEYMLNEILGDYSLLKDGDYGKDISDMRGFVEIGMRKPVVGILGRSDSGKSTLINKLLGSNRLPTGWTPKTSINIFIKHIEDRPKYIEDEVWVFRRKDGYGNAGRPSWNGNAIKSERRGADGYGDNYEDGDENWDHTRLNDEKYCRDWKLAGGPIEMLASFGTHDGLGYRQYDIGSAVLFLDAPVLKNIDLLDIPGFTGAMERDAMLAKNARGYIDALVYLSQANSFLTTEDMEFLKVTLPLLCCVEGLEDKLKPLANIYVLASQAHIINRGDMAELTRILDKGCLRFQTSITDVFWKVREQAFEEYRGEKHDYTENDLRSRFFPYSIDIPELCRDFENDLKRLTEMLPSIIKKLAVGEIKNQCGMAMKKIDDDINTYTLIINDTEQARKEFNEYKANEYRRAAENKRRRDNITSAIKKASLASEENLTAAYNRLVNVKMIKRIIIEKSEEFDQKEKETGQKIKENDRKNLLLSYINAILNAEYFNVVEKEALPVLEEIRAFIYDFSVSGLSVPDGKLDVKVPIDAGIFAGALAGAGTAGGLWLGASMAGNLGGYILVAKGVGILSSLGISVGGGAAATSAVAAIGGPITLGIALPFLAAASAWAFFRTSWQERAAKQICEQLEKQDALGLYKDATLKFWRDCLEIFNKGVDEMEAMAKSYVEAFANKINVVDLEKVGEHKAEAEKARKFFEKVNNLVEMFRT